MPGGEARDRGLLPALGLLLAALAIARIGPAGLILGAACLLALAIFDPHTLGGWAAPGKRRLAVGLAAVVVIAAGGIWAAIGSHAGEPATAAAEARSGAGGPAPSPESTPQQRATTSATTSTDTTMTTPESPAPECIPSSTGLIGDGESETICDGDLTVALLAPLLHGQAAKISVAAEDAAPCRFHAQPNDRFWVVGQRWRYFVRVDSTRVFLEATGSRREPASKQPPCVALTRHG